MEVLRTMPQERNHNTASFWDKFWKDKHGNVVIWQMPNKWLIGWAVFTALSLLLNSGRVADVFSWLGSLSLIIWSLLEIIKGLNYFRRLLGLVVLAMAIATVVRSF